MSQIHYEFEKIYHLPPDAVCFAPGRVNLIGEHTDYNGGNVLPIAIHLGIRCAAAVRHDRKLRFFSQNFPDCGMIECHLDELEKKGCWADYPISVIKTFSAFGYPIENGADFYFSSDLPDGAGMSSSAALEVAVGMMLSKLYSLPLTKQELALIGQFAENRFIGVNCGIMDQFASAMGKKDHAILLNAHTLSYQYVPLENACLVIVNSGVKHSLASSAYNDRQRECETARKLLKVPTLCSLSREEFDKRSDSLTDDICHRRARHVVYENMRTIDAANALKSGDLRTFGKLMNDSHRSLRDDYEVSCEELDFLVHTAQNIHGVYGSRMTGGGFGGCTVNLIEKSAEDDFIRVIKQEYRKHFHITPDVYSVTVSDGAGFLGT